MKSEKTKTLDRIVGTAGRVALATAVAATGFVGVMVSPAPKASAATPQTIQMGELSASMTPQPGSLPGDASITCVKTATTTGSGGTETAGGVYVTNGSTSWLAHGEPFYGSCPPGTAPADVQNQSTIGFQPMAPATAQAGTPFLLGQVAHQNWVITDDRQDGGSGATRLYGDLNLRFGGAIAGKEDSFSWNLYETPNDGSSQIERDSSGNPLYWQRNADGTFTLTTTPQPYPFDDPAYQVARNASGQMLYWHYDNYGYRVYQDTTPDPRAANDLSYFDPVVDNSGYVDDQTTFSDVRSTKIFTTSGGMPYRLVIRGFTSSDGTCPATPPSGQTQQVFNTHENQVTYGCLYASWEQERPIVVEKEAQNNSTTTPTIPTFQYGVQQWDPATGSYKTPTADWQSGTGWTDFGLQPTGFGEAGVVQTDRRLLVPIDGVQVTETVPTPRLTSTSAGWALTSVQCVQGPATVDPTDPTKFVPAPVDWSQAGSATYPYVLNKDGSPITVNATTGQVNLNDVAMSDSTATLGITCRYVNTYADVPAPKIQVVKTINGQDANGTAPANPGHEGDATVVETPAGSMMDFGFTVTNTGNVALTGVVVTDDKVAASKIVCPVATQVNGQSNTIASLAPGQSVTCSAPQALAAAAPGQSHLDTATVTGTPTKLPDGSQPPKPSDTDPGNATTPLPPAFAVKKNVEGDTDGGASPAIVLDPATKTFTLVYDVVVTNTGTVAAPAPAVTDTMTVPGGFTVTGVTVDGVAQTPASTTVTIPAGTAPLDPAPNANSSVTHKVVVTGTFDPATVAWTTVGDCTVTNGTATGGGFINKVTLPGDSDGESNNTTCTPFTAPAYSVEKKTTQAPVQLSPGQAEVTRDYTVTVTNTGTATGTSPQVVDIPEAPQGFTITKVLVDGVEKSAPYQVTPGDSLAPGATKDHTVTVTYAVDQSQITPGGWTNLGSCDAADATPDRTKGLYNLVTMEGDTDGANNNDACTPVNGPATVSKVVTPGSPNPVVVDRDGRFTVSYDIVVTNPSATAPAAYNAITDKPGFPAGFPIDQFTVNGGTPVTPNAEGIYAVSEAGTLAPSESKTFTIVIVGHTTLPSSEVATAGRCGTADGTGTPGQGLYNLVEMAGDPDTSDNDACVNIEKPGFAVKKETAQDPMTLAPGATTASREYQVTVSNSSTVAGTSPVVTDRPSQPTGFTLSGATVDGQPVTIGADGVFRVTDGVPLGAGQPKVFTVVVTYAVDQTAPIAWVNVGTCAVESGATDPAKGLYNVVSMEGDSDGTDNNDACVPVTGTPTFSVAKSTSQAAVVLAPGQTEVTRDYTVTVQNTSAIAGTSAQVVDVPEAPQGFRVVSVTVDGGTPQVAAPYIVTTGDALGAKGVKAHTVRVVYAVDQAAIMPGGWTNLGECSTNGATTDKGKGLYNLVTMDGDTDGADNNDACTTVTGTPMFAVKKDTAAGPMTLGVDDTTATRTYTVTVTNTGNVAGRSPAVIDQPSQPVGFTLSGVKVDGASAAITNGSFEVTPGVQLAKGESKSLTVEVTYVVDQDQVDWTAVGECRTDGESTEPAKGLYNKVTMGGDTDGEDNNDTCTPVKPTTAFAVRKSTDQAPFVLDRPTTSVSRTYTVSVENTSHAPGTSPVVTDTPGHPAGFSVTGVTVDGAPATIANGSFQVTAGVQLAAGATKDFTVTVTYAVDQSAITQQGWKDLATCEAGLAGSNPAKGLYNVVDMAGDTDGTENNDACTPLQGPSELKIVKYVNGQDANTAPGVAVEPGQPMQVTYLVTNTGTTSMADVAVADQVLSPSGTVVSTINPDATKWNVTTMATSAFAGTLEPGEAVLFRATVPAPAAGVQHTDVAVATGTPPTPPGGTPPPPVTSPPDEGNAWTPELKVVKKLNGLQVHTDDAALPAKPGDRVEVSLEVSNRGLGDMKDVTVTDRIVQGATAPMTVICPAPAHGNVIPTLAAGQTVVCTASFVMPNGVHQDQASVTGTPEVPPTDVPGENPPPVTPPGVPPVVPPTVPPVTSPPSDGFAKTPSVEVIKFINGDDADTAPGVIVQPGSRMTITYKVTNTGAMPLSGVTVTDRVTAGGGQVEGLSCPKDDLAVGESMECTATMVAPATGGVQHTNIATVTGQPPTPPGGQTPPKVSDDNPGNSFTESKPSVKIVKSINGDDANQAPGVSVAAGSTMDIDYVVTNAGNTPLTGVTVTDDKIAASQITCPKTELVVGESMTCKATFIAPAAGGQHVNTGTVTGQPPANPDGSTPPPATSTDKAHAHVPPAPGQTPPPVEPPAPKPWFPPLANTGGPTIALLLGGLAAVIGGGAMLRRRRHDEG